MLYELYMAKFRSSIHVVGFQQPSTESSAPDKKGNKDNLGIISHILHKNILCDPSLELSRRDGSNEGSQHMFSLRIKNNYL